MQVTAGERGTALGRIGLTGPALDTFCEDVGASPDYVLDLFDRLIITIAAWKGGVGKTELAKELAWLLDGVLVDLDWDAGGATRAWGYRHETRTNAPLLDALERGRCPRPLSGKGVRADLIPSHPDFSVNQPASQDMAAALEKWSAELKRPLVIDTHPGGVPSTVGAASAAHVVVVPVNLETRALAATEQMANELQGGYPLLFVPNRVEAAPRIRGEPPGEDQHHLRNRGRPARAQPCIPQAPQVVRRGVRTGQVRPDSRLQREVRRGGQRRGSRRFDPCGAERDRPTPGGGVVVSDTAVSGGLSKLRAGRQRRAGQVPPPKHPAAPHTTDPQNPANAETTAPATANSPAPTVEPAGQQRAGQESASPAAAATPPAPPTSAPTEVAPAGGTTSAPQPTPTPAPAAASPAQTVVRRPLPDLIIDWSDPVMHVVRATRLSVASSVFDAFKAAAEQPGQPPQTSLIMAAVSTHLARLPELVLARRPEEHTDFSSFYRRPAAPSRNRTDPQVPLYIRPNGGEDQALNRIVDWVNAIITDGHPGRREASRSEIVAAALAAEYLASSKR